MEINNSSDQSTGDGSETHSPVISEVNPNMGFSNVSNITKNLNFNKYIANWCDYWQLATSNDYANDCVTLVDLDNGIVRKVMLIKASTRLWLFWHLAWLVSKCLSTKILVIVNKTPST